MYNLEWRLRYLHLLMRLCPYKLLPESTSTKHEYGGKFWGHRWRHHHEKYFFGIIWDGLFISEVKLQLCLIFQNFQKGRHFQVATFCFTGCFTGSWNSNIDGDILISKFDLLCDLVTSSMTSWICVYINVVIISWYLCTGSLMMISLLIF